MHTIILQYKKILAFACILLLFPIQAPAAQSTQTMLFYGEASWYGGRFQGRQTANGETFDTYKLTAAHKNLPFGSIVKVTNLKNEKNVTVRINDRGPFSKGRVIDLSFAAARTIAMLRDGTAKVEVRVIKLGDNKRNFKKTRKIKIDRKVRKIIIKRSPVKRRQHKSVKKQPLVRNISRPGYYVIQAGAFRRQFNAVSLAKKLIAAGFTTFVYKADAASLFKVWIGYFDTRNKAIQTRQKVKTRSFKGFVKKIH